MSNCFIDPLEIEKVSTENFNNMYPFPWQGFKNIFKHGIFQQLNDEFPMIDLFERHQGIKRGYGQRPHNRLYLAYNKSIYAHNKANAGRGVIKYQDLSVSWQGFIDYLEKSTDYRRFISTIMCVKKFKVRYAWHMGMSRSEVSPHVDLEKKIGTHIFYFNTKDDWKPEWGGETLLLSGKTTDRMNPDFSEFTSITPVNTTKYQSLLLKNMPNAWHGVKPLICPEGKYRKLFNVIFEIP